MVRSAALLLNRQKNKEDFMNALHLIWIVPLSASVGFVMCALFVAAKEDMPDE